MSKFAVISHTLPPSPSGQAVILGRILSELDPEKYYLIASRGIGMQGSSGAKSTASLKAHQYNLPAELTLKGPNWWWAAQFKSLLNLFIHFFLRYKNISNILRSEPTTTGIVACTGDLLDIPVGFLVSRLMGKSFYAYIFDDYVYQWTGIDRLFAKFNSAYIFRHTRGIIGPNEFICKEYDRRYSLKSILIRNPCDREGLKKEPNLIWPARSGNFNIVYTGAIYHANYQCFQNLVEALKLLEEYKLELHIFTAQSRAELESLGIEGENIFIHSHISYGQILEEHRQADILFLPLAFNSPISEVIRTSAPAKMGDYLSSGRPVLAHVPPDSFVAYYMNSHTCGMIADRNDAQTLAAQINKIIVDPVFRTQIMHNSRDQAVLDFTPELASNRLSTLLNEERLL